MDMEHIHLQRHGKGFFRDNGPFMPFPLSQRNARDIYEYFVHCKNFVKMNEREKALLEKDENYLVWLHRDQQKAYVKKLENGMVEILLRGHIILASFPFTPVEEYPIIMWRRYILPEEKLSKEAQIDLLNCYCEGIESFSFASEEKKRREKQDQEDLAWRRERDRKEEDAKKAHREWAQKIHNKFHSFEELLAAPIRERAEYFSVCFSEDGRANIFGKDFIFCVPEDFFPLLFPDAIIVEPPDNNYGNDYYLEFNISKGSETVKLTIQGTNGEEDGNAWVE